MIFVSYHVHLIDVNFQWWPELIACDMKTYFLVDLQHIILFKTDLHLGSLLAVITYLRRHTCTCNRIMIHAACLVYCVNIYNGSSVVIAVMCTYMYDRWFLNKKINIIYGQLCEGGRQPLHQHCEVRVPLCSSVDT